MVRKKNVLATMAQSLAATALVSVLWAAIGYSLTFTGDGPALGSLDRLLLHGMGMGTISPLAKTIPESLFMIYQMTFAIITVALVAGSVADRMRFSAFVLFAALWLLFVYVPIAHWVWGGGFLAAAGLLDFAGGTVVHVNAGVAGLVAAYVLGARRGYGTENLAPYDLSLAVIGTGLLWVGWFGFNGGSALGANSRAAMAIVATHLAASAGALTWAAIEWGNRGKPSVLGMISGAVAGLGTITPASGFVLPWHAFIIGIIAGAVCYWACTTLGLRRFARRVRRARRRRNDGHAVDWGIRRRSFVGKPRCSGNRRAVGAKSPAGADPALRRRRNAALVGRYDFRAAQVHQRVRATARDPAERVRGARHQPARRGAAIADHNAL
jgi:Amt family ammonium transporter